MVKMVDATVRQTQVSDQGEGTCNIWKRKGLEQDELEKG